ncbi:MAG: tyrosine-type recombinase/integrase [Candidatus Nitrosopumilus sp. bin_68KS]
MKNQHSLIMFQESLQSEHTRKKYTQLVSMFKDYHKIHDFDGILNFKQSDLQMMVETYVIHIKKIINPNTIPTYINPIKTFLETNDVDLNWRKIKRLYPSKIKRSGSSAYQTKDIELMLKVTPQIRNKAVIHFLASTGCRIGALVDLKIKHLRDMSFGCKMVTIYEDSTEEYFTFLTPESSKALELYFIERQKNGEIFHDETPIFRIRYQLASIKAKSLSTNSAQQILHRAVSNASLRGQKKNGRYAEQLAHGFRKRFNTILKLNNQVNDNAIEKMMGHKKGLDGTYLQITPAQLFEEFKKGIADLTIDQSEIQKVKIEKLESDKSELEQTKIKLEDAVSKVEQLWADKQRMEQSQKQN